MLGAPALGEFGDDPDRYANAKSRKNYAGTSPITIASGKKSAVLATSATAASTTPSTSGPSARSPRHPVPDTTTVPCVSGERPITRRCEPWPIDWWGSFTAVSTIGSPTPKELRGLAPSLLPLDISDRGMSGQV